MRLRCGLCLVTFQVDALFAAYDTDGGGSIDYRELQKTLRKEAEIDPSLRAGAKGAIVMTAKNKHSLRSSGSKAKGENGGGGEATNMPRMLQGVELSVERSEALVDQLAAALRKKWVRARDLFLEWDTNGDGLISRSELHRALAALGISSGLSRQMRLAVDAFFDDIDTDGTGYIDFKELHGAAQPSAVSSRAARLRSFGWQPRQKCIGAPSLNMHAPHSTSTGCASAGAPHPAAAAAAAQDGAIAVGSSRRPQTAPQCEARFGGSAMRQIGGSAMRQSRSAALISEWRRQADIMHAVKLRQMDSLHRSVRPLGSPSGVQDSASPCAASQQLSQELYESGLTSGDPYSDANAAVVRQAAGATAPSTASPHDAAAAGARPHTSSESVRLAGRFDAPEVSLLSPRPSTANPTVRSAPVGAGARHEAFTGRHSSLVRPCSMPSLEQPQPVRRPRTHTPSLRARLQKPTPYVKPAGGSTRLQQSKHAQEVGLRLLGRPGWASDTSWFATVISFAPPPAPGKALQLERGNGDADAPVDVLAP